MSDSGNINATLLGLFQTEAETHIGALREALPAVRAEPDRESHYEILLRAAHSLKGASRIVDIDLGVRLAHAMEALIAATGEGERPLADPRIEQLLAATDAFEELVSHAGDAEWLAGAEPRIAPLIEALNAQSPETRSPETRPQADTAAEPAPATGDGADAADDMMLELFQGEAETHLRTLNTELLKLEAEPQAAAILDALMRAAHSLKGAARMVGQDRTVALAHQLEDIFTAAQQDRIRLRATDIDTLLRAVDQLQRLCAPAEVPHDPDQSDGSSEELSNALTAIAGSGADSVGRAESGSRDATETGGSPVELDPEMLELFRTEADAQLQAIADSLLRLEQNPGEADHLEAVMRAAHSVKGAARMVGIDAAVQLAHLMEDIFSAAQNGRLQLDMDSIDILLAGTDLLQQLAQSGDIPAWCEHHRAAIAEYDEQLRRILAGESVAAPAPPTAAPADTPGGVAAQKPADKGAPASRSETAIRVSTESLNRLMGLAGEVQVEARWLRPFADSLLQIKQRQTELISMLDRMRDQLDHARVDEYTRGLFQSALQRAGDCRHLLSERLAELEEYDRRSHHLATRLNREVIASRMRPFADGVHGFQRMVRDVSRSLGKQVRLDIGGLETQVDRDILDKIEAPLNHLLRNAVDHGIETPEERRRAGKAEQAHVRLEAIHSAGMLSIIVEDDGRGIEPEDLRGKVVRRNLVSEEMARDLSLAELMEFIFLPGFSTRDSVTEISGRGVGLDVVHSVVQEMHGLVNAVSHPGQGMRFHMQLPLTLSVMRSLLVEIAGEPYAFPLAQINRTLKIDRSLIQVMEGRQYFTLGNHHIGLVAANQLLGLPEAPPNQGEACIVVLGERLDRYGFVVDRFLGERSLVVNPLDARLGKVQDIAAAATLENGHPCLILDTDDLLRSADLLISGGRLEHIDKARARQKIRTSKRVLVVDDSITVREVERNMLANIGYEVEVAVDGMDGWNAVRVGDYDLVISDIDMPRMNGFEFVGMIKKDPALKSLPVMIVSYKDREEDRTRGLEVGADYYLTKGSFQDATLIDAVLDLIGEP